MSIQAVIFDFGGVILAPLGQEHLHMWARRLGFAPAALAEALWGAAWHALEKGEIDTVAYNRRLARALRLPDAEAVERFITAFYADERLYPEMLDLIARLRRGGRVKLALLTNAFVGHAEVMQRKWGLDPRQMFDVYINSAEVGMAKPDPAIFELTLARLSVPPGAAIFIDDGAPNVAAAARLGLHTIHFDGPESLQRVVAEVERLVRL
jgi:putative hydrolase of the HAD superfamily